MNKIRYCVFKYGYVNEDGTVTDNKLIYKNKDFRKVDIFITEKKLDEDEHYKCIQQLNFIHWEEIDNSEQPI